MNRSVTLYVLLLALSVLCWVRPVSGFDNFSRHLVLPFDENKITDPAESAVVLATLQGKWISTIGCKHGNEINLILRIDKKSGEYYSICNQKEYEKLERPEQDILRLLNTPIWNLTGLSREVPTQEYGYGKVLLSGYRIFELSVDSHVRHFLFKVSNTENGVLHLDIFRLYDWSFKGQTYFELGEQPDDHSTFTH